MSVNKSMFIVMFMNMYRDVNRNIDGTGTDMGTGTVRRGQRREHGRNQGQRQGTVRGEKNPVFFFQIFCVYWLLPSPPATTRKWLHIKCEWNYSDDGESIYCIWLGEILDIKFQGPHRMLFSPCAKMIHW
jgi:hypothetical protein